MGDSFSGVLRFAAPRPGRRKAAKFFSLAVDHPEVDVGEAHDPVAVRRLGDADRLTDQGLADEDQLAAPLDLAGAAHPPHRMVGIVPWLFDPLRIGPRRSRVAARWRLLVERLVRPFAIVVPAEAVKAPLLAFRRGSGWLRSLLLQRPMQALVAAVLLRRAAPSRPTKQWAKTDLSVDLPVPTKQAKTPA